MRLVTVHDSARNLAAAARRCFLLGRPAWAAPAADGSACARAGGKLGFVREMRLALR
jgi:hypothetical protein